MPRGMDPNHILPHRFYDHLMPIDIDKFTQRAIVTICISRPYLHELALFKTLLFDILFLPIIVIAIVAAAVSRFNDSISIGSGMSSKSIP